MKLSTRVRYGLRALVELAAIQEESPVLLDTIANRQGISRKYLDSIFSRLKAAGIVHSTRGAGGGFTLRSDPSEVTVADVYTSIEGPLKLVACLEGSEKCPSGRTCATVELWEGLSQVMVDYLSEVTLEDLVRRRAELASAGPNMFYI